MSYSNFKMSHYFNNILFTPWPSFMGICLFMFIYLSLLTLNKYFLFALDITFVGIYFFFHIMCESVMYWCMEVIRESFSGKYTKKLSSALLFGFLLFLVSEAMLFGSIFWAYFDRLFHMSYVTGFLSVPTTVETMSWYKEPLYATMVLLASGWSSNYAYYLFQLKNVNALKKAYLLGFLTNLLGCVFLYMQYMEYTHLSFTMSQTAYCAAFYTLTGFHGIHVLMGNYFLFIQYSLKFFYFDHKTHGLGYAVLYWHFVDIIWMFLFISVYFFNNFDYITVSYL